MVINVIMMMVAMIMLKPEPKDGHGEAKSGHRACGVRGSKEEVAARPDQKKSWFLLFYKKKHRKNCECCPGHYLSTSIF